MNNGYSIGDLSRSMMLSTSNTRLRAQLTELTQVSTTGVKSDIPKATGGSLGPLAQLTAALGDLEGYGRNIAQASLELDSVQQALGRVQKATDDLGPAYLAEAGRGDWAALSGRAGQANGQLEDVMSALRTRAGERFVFGGTVTDTPPVGTADALMAEIRAVAVGGTVADRIAAVEKFFDDPSGAGGFIDKVYAGSDTNAQIRVSDQRTVTASVRADDGAVRAVLKGLALSALAADAGVTRGDGLLLMQRAGEVLMSSQQEMTWARANLGLQEQINADAGVANESAKTALSLSRNAITSADPYEAATAIEETQTRLEALYALTSRLSRLSLTEYLR